MSFWGFRDYVPVAARRANAAKEVAKLRKRGRAVSPVVIEGRKIADASGSTIPSPPWGGPG